MKRSPSRRKRTVSTKTALTPRQQRFVAEYLVDLNGTQAAIRAGYSPKTARAIATENLTKPAVADAIAIEMARRSERTEITIDMVLKELAAIGFANAGDFFEWGPDGIVIRPKETLTREQQGVVAEVSQTVTKDGGSVRVKLHDKASALEKIGRHLGGFGAKVTVGVDPDDPLGALIRSIQGSALPLNDPNKTKPRE
ncbi:MAG: terminase small subunit [Rhodoblastus sp.]|nr:MAG: terminase small subunit [Rhodoblastus sp.]